jgi:transmembrane sensor
MRPIPKPRLEPSPAGDAFDPLVKEALAWIVRLHSGDETAADCAAFEDWKAASDRHAAAARQAEALWQSLRPALHTWRGSRRRVLSLAVVTAAGVALAAGAALQPHSYTQLVADHRTATGEVRSIALKDGSVVDLDTDTAFDVSDDQRTLTLYSGQIFVKVAPDPSRPFRVVTEKAETRALGTAFAVRLDKDSERIVVTEHAVRVTTATRRSVDVEEGQAVEIGPARSEKPYRVDADSLLAWRKGGLQFRDLPFASVVAEVERYRPGRIVVLDDEVRRLAVTGNFDVGDTDAFLNAAAVSLPVSIARLPGLVVVWRDTSRPLPSR